MQIHLRFHFSELFRKSAKNAAGSNNNNKQKTYENEHSQQLSILIENSKYEQYVQLAERLLSIREQS